MTHRFVHPVCARTQPGCWLAALTLLVASCSTTPPTGPVRAPEATSTPATEVPRAPAALTEAPTEPPGSLPRPSAAAGPAWTAPTFAGHPQLDPLARQLSARNGLDVSRTRHWLSLARKVPDSQRFIMPSSNPGAKNWLAYRQRFVEPIRLRAAAEFWRQNRDALNRAEKEFGVPASIIVGIVGVETIYGRQMGQYRVLDVLTTLSLEFPTGRSDRSAYFQQELGQWLSWCQEKNEAPDQALSSFAGAMGMPQFMPTALRQYAIDYDGDGQIDLAHSAADTIGSVARYLAGHGWVRGQATHFPVTVPDNTRALSILLTPDIVPTFSPRDMEGAGVGLPPAALRHDGPLALVMLNNANKAPTFVAGTQNFFVLTRYNQSSYYALAVIELAQAAQKNELAGR